MLSQVLIRVTSNHSSLQHVHEHSHSHVPLSTLAQNGIYIGERAYMPRHLWLAKDARANII